MGISATTPRVVLYTRGGCTGSAEALHWLAMRHIPFTEERIRTNPLTPSSDWDMPPIGTPLLVVGDRAVYGFRPIAYELALRAF